MAKKGSGNIAQTVWALAEPVAEQLGYFLWDVEYVKEGARMILRLTIDSEDGVNIEDCERMHRAIDPVLDEADPIESAYYLEVSSPGIERELRTDDHIYACEGWEVELRLFAPVDGVRVLRGVLGGLDEQGNVVLLVGQERKCFPRAAVAKLQTVFDFAE